MSLMNHLLFPADPHPRAKIKVKQIIHDWSSFGFGSGGNEAWTESFNFNSFWQTFENDGRWNLTTSKSNCLGPISSCGGWTIHASLLQWRSICRPSGNFSLPFFDYWYTEFHSFVGRLLRHKNRRLLPRTLGRLCSPHSRNFMLLRQVLQ